MLSTVVIPQVWVRDVLEAQQVLDYQTGRRYSKLQVHTLPPLQFLVLPLPGTCCIKVPVWQMCVLSTQPHRQA